MNNIQLDNRESTFESVPASEMPVIAVVDFRTITDVIEGLSDTGRSIALRSMANSALFQAISGTADYFNYISKTQYDELQAERLRNRSFHQAQVYAYFSAEALTHAESTYDEAMSFDDMFTFVQKAEPKAPDTAAENYDPKFLSKIGLTVEQAIEADIEEHAKDLERFTVKVETMKTAKAAIRAAVESADPGQPDIPVVSAYRMLQKAELKIANEPVRLWKLRNKIPGATSKMIDLTTDLPVLKKAIKTLRNDYKGDDRVRFDD